MPESFLYIALHPGDVPPMVPLIVGRNYIAVSMVEVVEAWWGEGLTLKKRPMVEIVVVLEV